MLLQLKQDVDYLKEVVAKAGLVRKEAPAIAAPESIRAEEIVSDWSVDEDPEEQDYELSLKQEDMSIKTANMELIEKVLRKHGGNRKAAAAELGISERTLYRKIKQMTDK
jgi:transcriptional regulator with PAS, ATPase and Fis domain